jgi:hypothetical protein
MYESFFKRDSDLLQEIVVQLYFIMHALLLIRRPKSGEERKKEPLKNGLVSKDYSGKKIFSPAVSPQRQVLGC